MAAFLVIKENEETLSFPCEQIITLGRDKGNDIVLEDLKASRNHAMVRSLGQENFYLIDGGSSNGTFLNAKRISLPTILKNGDIITLGSSHVVFSQVHKESVDDFDDEDTQTIMINPVVEVTKFVLLVADIRGFTSIAESIPIQSLTEIMNAWFHAVRKCILKHDGIIDKFLGDCVYARWEAGENLTGVLYHALAAAVELNALSEKLNSTYEKQLSTAGQLCIGVGINAGIAALGVDQSNSAIGDAVNLTFRLESATRDIGKDVVLGKDAFEHLPSKFSKGRQQAIWVKGKSDQVEVCGLFFQELKKMLNS